MPGRLIAESCLRRLGGPFGCALAAVLAAVSCAAVPGEKQSGAPPIQLVESVPIETQLGNPDLPAARDVWLDMIRGAHESLDFEEFYLSNWPGEPLEPVLREIGAAAARGVRVRILLDARMHETYPQPADSFGTVPGIEVRTIDMGEHGGGVQHAKYFMVDGREVFLGSQNMDWRALEHIHELGVRIRDERVTDAFRRVFEMDWAAGRGGNDVSPSSEIVERATAWNGEAPIAIAQAAGDSVLVWPTYSPKSFSPDSSRWDRDMIVGLLDRARSEAIVQLLSYGRTDRGLEDDAIDGALRRASERGVRVRILVSDWQADSRRIEDLEALAESGSIEVKMSVVPEWSGGYIPFARVEHCKYMVVDSVWTWLGTSNWAPSYFHTSRNVAVTMRNRNLALQARQVFETSWSNSGAIAVRRGATYAPRIHGLTPPPGRQAYGD